MPANSLDSAPVAPVQCFDSLPAGEQPPLVDHVHAPVWRAEFTGSVAISGLSARLPQSDSVDEFRDRLMSHDDMVTESSRSWTPGLHGTPSRSGKLKDLTKFDSMFFGVSHKQAHRMDPQMRMLLEVTHEAIVDAGVDPASLRGSKTGVFIGASESEAACAWSADAKATSGLTLIGCQRGMFSNRLSYFFDFRGPSFTVDTACSSSLLAMDLALTAMRTGQCDQAIVGGSNITIRLATSVQFSKLGMLSGRGMCQSFDESGDGYCRSEGIVAIMLQKSADARRIYATLVHSKNNCDGAKDGSQAITFPSGASQTRLMKEVYAECGVDPASVAYVEAHGTGTKAGDPQELSAITDVFCKSRVGPLLIGSTKSNMGHPEPASGLAALAKIIVAMEEKVIPANLHYSEPNADIPGLLAGKLKVVATNTPWAGGLTAVNSFGFGGANVHALLDSHKKVKAPPSARGPAELPRLLMYAGRTSGGLRSSLQRAATHAADAEFVALLHRTAFSTPKAQPYRGYALVSSDPGGSSSGQVVEIKKCAPEKRPIWYVFAGMGTQWNGMGRDLMQLACFRESILRSDAVLKPLGVELASLVVSSSDATNDFGSTINAFVGIAAIQVALVDTLRSLNLAPDGIVGHSVGELGCAYADGSLTAKEAVLAAYWRGKCIVDACLEPGAMAAVGLSWEEARRRCPAGVVPACHNSLDTVTISGPRDAVGAFVEKLKDEGVFAKEVQSNGVAFHSYYMASIASKLREALSKVIVPKERSGRWVSTSIPQSEWGSSLARMSSADYHVNNLVSPVLFQEGLRLIPDDAVVIEIAPHCLLQAILKRSVGKGCENIGLQKRDQKSNLEFFLSNLGKLYMAGCEPHVASLYPAVSFPVSSGTPRISSLVDWDHSETFDVPGEKDFDLSSYRGDRGQSDFKLSSTFELRPESGDLYLLDHKIDGRILFPAAGYLLLAWKALAAYKGKQYETMPVVFDDVVILNATLLPREGSVTLDTSLLPATGAFEISHAGTAVATGKVMSPGADEGVLIDAGCRAAALGATADALGQNETLTPSDVYKELRLRGYEYGPAFQGICSSHLGGTTGQLAWTGNWVTFLDAMLQLTILSASSHSGLRLPTRIRSTRISPRVQEHKVLQSRVTAVVDNHIGAIEAGGVQIFGLHTTSAGQRKDPAQPLLESYEFIPFRHSLLRNDGGSDVATARQYACACLQYASRWPLLQPSSSDAQVSDAGHVAAGTHQDGLLLAACAEAAAAGGAEALAAVARVDPNRDLLLQRATSAACLKPLLDLALENAAGSGLSSGRKPLVVVELHADRWRVYERAVPMLLSQPLVSVDYLAVCEPGGGLPELAAAAHLGAVSFASWSAGQPPAEQLKRADLVVCRCANADECHLVAIGASALLKDGGFLLLLAPTANHAVHALLAAAAGRPQQHQSGLQHWTDEEWTSCVEGHGYCSLAATFDGCLDTAFLFRSCSDELTRPLPGLATVLRIDDLGTSWVDELKEKFAQLQTHSGPDARRRRLWLVANDCKFSGIVGLVNCLRQEPGGELIRCIFNRDLEGTAMQQSSLDVHYESLRRKDLVFNVFSNDEWGSFRHLPLDKGSNYTCTKYAYVNVAEKGGGLSHLRWIESPLKFYREHREKELCTVSYSSLNFRDVMLATGKLPPDAIPGHVQMQDCLLGMEFSGHRSSGGARVMGLLAAKGLATYVDADPRFLWPVPDEWSLEEAATVPVVYATAYYALVVRAQIRRGQSVLIHSGSGGVGQAAIAVALQYGCEVFTSVGSLDKRQFLMELFPQLSESSFCNSRDASFEYDIKRRTGGRGVDVVLNSLAEDKLQASVRVLAPHGAFLEIGKYDLANNSPLGMSVFLKNVTFHGILLDALFEDGSRDWARVRDLVTEGIAAGAVKPLPATVFDRDQVEDAFRYMAQGKHMGKVLVKVNDNNDPAASRVDTKPVKAVPRVYCDPDKCYVITGGLGGFGLELASWLVRRGCRKLVLTSRSGVSTGYQARCLARWQAEDGVQVLISRSDVGTQDGAQVLVREASALGPVGAIFHLAMVLKDGFLENLTATDFEKVFAPKVAGVCHLDRLMRGPAGKELDHFVVFSSIVGARGNAGQANYGFANAAMERVCESRVRDGFPGVAIQWGAIGDVGVVVSMLGGNEAVIGGTLPQRIASCLDSLDVLLTQRGAAVVSSFVRADVETASGGAAAGGTQDVVAAVAHILGISDASSLSDEASLGDLGLDSLMGVEVKQVLERDFNVVLPMKAIRALTLAKLRELAAAARPGAAPTAPQQLHVDGGGSRGAAPPAAVRLLRPTAASKLMPDERLVPMNAAAASAAAGRPTIFVHPIEGDVAHLKQVAAVLPLPAYGLQCVSDAPLESIEALAAHYIRVAGDAGLSLSSACIVGYSFGAAVAFEMARQLEASSAAASDVRLVLLDGSHAYVAAHTNRYKASFTDGGQQQGVSGSTQVTAEAEVEATCAFLLQIADFDYHQVRSALAAERDYGGRLSVAAALLTPFGYAADDVKLAAESFLTKLVAADAYRPAAGAYRGNVVLIKSSVGTPSEKLGSDYGLSQVSQGHVVTYTVEGDHKTFLQQLSAARVAQLIQDVSGNLNSH